MELTYLLILIAVAVGCTPNLTLLCTAENIYYVKPTNSSNINDTSFDPDTLCLDHDYPCYTFDYYLQNISLYFTSNTWIQFLPGIHLLDMGPGENIVEFNNISNLTLAGSNSTRQAEFGLIMPESTILCTSGIGFVFRKIEHLTIQHLTFHECSCEPFPDYAFALVLINLTNSHLSHVYIYKSRGYGIVGLNVLGTSSITDSAVLFSSGSEDYPGGNAFFNFYPSESDCYKLGNNTVQFSVKSSSFAFGRNRNQLASPTGLGITIENPCSNSYITIYGSFFYHNQNLSAESSGNLVIIFYEQEATSNYVTIDNCIFKQGHSFSGGGILVRTVPKYPNTTCFNESSYTNFIRITNSIITENFAYYGGGLLVSFSPLDRSCHQNYLQLNEVLFEANVGFQGGGNAWLNSCPYEKRYNVKLINCIFRNGRAYIGGGGLELSLSDNVPDQNGLDQILLINTLFFGNRAEYGGGLGINISPVKVKRTLASQLWNVTMVNCTFSNNSASQSSAIYVQDDILLPVEFSIAFINLSVYDSKYSGRIKSCPKCDGKAILLNGVQNATIINGNFYNNEVGALKMFGSKLFLEGNISFHNNSGFKGAGIELCTDSYLYLERATNISFTDNHARYTGGAIYVKGRECNPQGEGSSKCFFNLNYPYHNSSQIFSQITFANNTAKHAGSALYGGYVDTCFPYHKFQQDVSELLLNNAECIISGGTCEQPQLPENGSQLFDLLFQFYQSGLSVVSSDPMFVCLCENDHPNCSEKRRPVSVYPGDVFTVSAVAVDQRDGVIPGVVTAVFVDDSGSLKLDEPQISQEVGSVCTNLQYTILSNNSDGELMLTAENPDKAEIARSNTHPPTLYITLLPCPPGFTLKGVPPQIKCDCVDKLINLVADCNSGHGMIRRPATAWIGYYGLDENETSQHSIPGVLLHEHCPFDYCKSEDIDIDLNFPDEQCAFNRSGTLCGACKLGLSLSLATSKCLDCSNVYLTLILVFLLAGVILIFALTAVNLTVSEGTISGLVFYANIVHVNKAIFFRSKSMHFFSIIIAWLNLDLGIETCFYDGMDMYARTWLQFVFPLYIWGMVIFMIVSSRYSTIAGKVFGRNNSVRVLATLLLLSYTKILRTIITALSFTTLIYPDKSIKFIWLADANVQYLSGKHIPLFLVALVFLLVLSLPYTALLLFLQCLWPRSHDYRLLSWLRKIKPFLDAHTGPYKDKYRFWAGFLFLVRIILFITFAVNSLGDTSLNLLFVSIVVMLLLGFKLIASGIYKNWLLDTLEASFFLNLGMLSVSSLYIQTVSSEGVSRDVVSSISLSVTYATFIGILIYHFRSHLPQTMRKIKQCLVHCYTSACSRRRTVPQMNIAELEGLVANNEDDADDADDAAGDSLAQPLPKVQCLRLTFDRNVTSGEAVLVEDMEDF